MQVKSTFAAQVCLASLPGRAVSVSLHAGKINSLPKRFSASAAKTTAETPALVYGACRMSKPREDRQDLPLIPQGIWDELRCGRTLQKELRPGDSGWDAMVSTLKEYWRS